MVSISVAEAKNQFSDLLRRAEYAGERVVVHRHGKPVAAIVSTQDLARLQALEDAEDVRDAVEALKEAEERGTTPLDVVLRKHGLAHLLVERPHSTRLRRSSARPARRPAAAKTTPKAASKKAR
jgi:prevent-host-death family protein